MSVFWKDDLKVDGGQWYLDFKNKDNLKNPYSTRSLKSYPLWVTRRTGGGMGNMEKL